AHGRQAADAAVGVLQGALSKEINEIAKVFISAAAHMSAWVDYPDDEIEELDFAKLRTEFSDAKSRLETLINRFDAGQAITEGVETVIVGKPNVGKSTLMNLLLGKERSIVTEVAGTTRDVVEETARIGNIVLRLSDTAGIRESGDLVESIGIEFARTKLAHSTLILAVVDSSKPLDDEDFAILKACEGKPSVCILNKTDLGQVVAESDVSPFVSKVLALSAKDEKSFEVLREALEELLGTAEFDSSAALLINERQLACCQKAVGCIDEAITAIDTGLTMDAVNVSVDAAIAPLLELTGERVSDAVVNEVFSKFCVGK
ncbi:MAG: 50S ribosome-binding GTPase, partial [Clostridia bacterium]|nr:50S ribosome-binding GTPase [Clostridia bacterium]